VISTDGQQRYLRAASLSDFLETLKICAVAGVINSAALVFEREAAVTSMMVP